MPPRKASDPWLPVPYDKADAAAIQALRRGDASAEQQIRAIGFIVEVICARNDMSFRPGPEGDRDTVFAEGRRFVGNQIVKLAKLPIGKLEGIRSERGENI